MTILKSVRDYVASVLSETVIYGQQNDAPQPATPYSVCQIVGDLGDEGAISTIKGLEEEKPKKDIEINHLQRRTKNVRVTCIGQNSIDRAKKVATLLNSVSARYYRGKNTFHLLNPLTVFETIEENGTYKERTYITISVRYVNEEKELWHSIEEVNYVSES